VNERCTYTDVERCFRSIPEVADFSITSPVHGELVLRITWTGTARSAEQVIRTAAHDCLPAGMIWGAHVKTAESEFVILPESSNYRAWFKVFKDFKSAPDDHVEPAPYSLKAVADRVLGGGCPKRWLYDYQLKYRPDGSYQIESRPAASYNSEADQVYLNETDMPLDDWKMMPTYTPPPVPFMKPLGFKCRNPSCPDRAPKPIQETCYTCNKPMEKIS
jgi:hypothetical protein